MGILNPKFFKLFFFIFIFSQTYCEKGPISAAKNFTPNLPPQILRIYSDPEGNSEMVPNMYFTIYVDSNDPNGNRLSYKFVSAFGSFFDQIDSDNGSKVDFYLRNDRLQGGQDVKIKVKVTDTKNASVEETFILGQGKAGPQLTTYEIKNEPVDNIIYSKSINTIELKWSSDSDGSYKFKLIPENETCGIDRVGVTLYNKNEIVTSKIVLSTEDNSIYDNIYRANDEDRLQLCLGFTDELDQTEIISFPLHIDDKVPVISDFTIIDIGQTCNSNELFIDNYDNNLITQWYISESQVTPDAIDPDWYKVKPIEYIFPVNHGYRNIYIWAKDGAGNISQFKSLSISNQCSWDKKIDGGFGGAFNPPQDIVYSSIIDSNKNIYIAGTIYNGTGFDWWIKKFNSNGIEEWDKKINGGYGNDASFTIITDSSNNVYIAGKIYNGSNIDWWIKKFNSNGNEIWDKKFDGGFGDDFLNSIMTDRENNLYLTGTSHNGNNTDWRIKKLKSNGDELWNKVIDSGEFDYANSMTIDSNNNIFVAGSMDGNDIIKKFSSSGIEDTGWDKLINTNLIYSIAIDSDDNIYIAGMIYNTNDDWHVLKLNFSGATLWERIYDGGFGNDRAKSIVVNLNDNNRIYVFGDTYNGNNTNWWIKELSSNGDEQWEKKLDGGYNWNDYAQAITIDSDGNIYLVGGLYNGNDTDWWIKKLTANGEPYL